jgi:hypothetical protein
MPFVDFMQSPFGRTLRVTLGLVLIILGLFAVGGALGIVLAVVGLVPLVAGVMGVCIAGPLFGADFHGYIRTR